ncbi:Lrp/AsnC family transcriptional regulator [Rhodoferax saidenbachensis]|uniref:DNA-binding Lrp family transcriptional regulator n=1 Tax=Rhodoferax saidenbachensis TaxID=1484693 RepID=A0ABU1ZK94_9BURK|nr:Lrp/AsnC family transcriptional regulator [Rhodoferax saidenbachensis]MDR7305977.1 DNA-binding Lrp family transcriptional regulator [Rhodoferax saidenbachensis]
MDGLDKIDLAILAKLQQDGRLPNAKLAEAFSLSEASCWRRQKRLEEAGVIEGYQATLNRRKLGIGVMAFVQIVCTQHGEEITANFERQVRACPNVLDCHNITGEADFLLKVVAKDLDDYSRFVERFLRQLPGVLSIRSSISLREMKAAKGLPVLEILNGG